MVCHHDDCQLGHFCGGLCAAIRDRELRCRQPYSESLTSNYNNLDLRSRRRDSHYGVDLNYQEAGSFNPGLFGNSLWIVQYSWFRWSRCERVFRDREMRGMRFTLKPETSLGKWSVGLQSFFVVVIA